MTNLTRPIPQEWCRKIVDQLLAVAKGCPEGSLMRRAAIERADRVMGGDPDDYPELDGFPGVRVVEAK